MVLRYSIFVHNVPYNAKVKQIVIVIWSVVLLGIFCISTLYGINLLLQKFQYIRSWCKDYFKNISLYLIKFDELQCNGIYSWSWFYILLTSNIKLATWNKVEHFVFIVDAYEWVIHWHTTFRKILSYKDVVRGVTNVYNTTSLIWEIFLTFMYILGVIKFMAWTPNI